MAPAWAPGWASAGYVLALQACLGFAYYGATANMVLLLQIYAGVTENRAESLTNYFGAVVGLTPLVGGFLSDKLLGCFHTIIVGGLLFAASLVMLTAAAFWHNKALLMPTLFVILPLGYGLLTSNVNVFGAHQFGDGKEKTSWFSWFYFSIIMGSILAFLLPGMLQQNVSFAVGLAVPCAVLLLGLGIFASAQFKFAPPSTSIEHESQDENLAIELMQDKSNGQIWSKVLPAMLLTIVFSICYCQMQTTWYVQGMWMNRKIFAEDMPVAYMMCADPLFVMLAIYILESFVFPRLRDAGCMPSPLARMGLGMGFSFCGMCSAYHVERLRLRTLSPGGLNQPSSLSILFQIPQFAFVAVAEVLVYTTIQEYAFSLAPASMKSTINAVNLLCGAIANVIAGVMTQWCSAWIPSSNPNLGHYDHFYLLLGVLCLIGGAGFHFLLQMGSPKKSANQPIYRSV